VAIMVPVSIFVIAPKVAQHAMTNTVVSIPNLTQAACSANYSKLWNHAVLNVPAIGPISLTTTIMEYTQEVYTTTCWDHEMGGITGGCHCDNPNLTKLGSYTSPEMTVEPGDNHKEFTVIMTSTPEDFMNIGPGWTFYLWFPMYLPAPVGNLILKASNVSVKVMGMTFKGLTMQQEVTCYNPTEYNQTTYPEPIPIHFPETVSLPNSVCHPDDPKHSEDQSPKLTAVCKPGKRQIHPCPTTTTTTPPPTPTPTPAPPTTAPTNESSVTV
jgi:hypothetical protein